MLRAKDVKVNGKITDDEYPMLQMTVEGCPIQFSVADLKPEKREWLLGVLGYQLQDLFVSAQSRARCEIKMARDEYLQTIES